MAPFDDIFQPTFESTLSDLDGFASTFDGRGIFDGTDDYVTVGGSLTFSDFDISIRFSTTDTGNQIILGDNHLDSYYFNIAGSANSVFIFYEGSNKSWSISGFDDGEVHTLRYVLTGTTVECFYDGVSQGTNTIVPYTGSNDFRIGDSNNLHSRFDGRVYDVTIKDGDGGTTLREYKFDETSGTNVPDTSGNSQDGTLSGDTGTNFWADNAAQ